MLTQSCFYVNFSQNDYQSLLALCKTIQLSYNLVKTLPAVHTKEEYPSKIKQNNLEKRGKGAHLDNLLVCLVVGCRFLTSGWRVNINNHFFYPILTLWGRVPPPPPTSGVYFGRLLACILRFKVEKTYLLKIFSKHPPPPLFFPKFCGRGVDSDVS